MMISLLVVSGTIAALRNTFYQITNYRQDLFFTSQTENSLRGGKYSPPY